jgi:exopolysaccharide/PEP-CTERM locus tyrosine autokinase
MERRFRDQFRHVKRPLLAAALGRGMEAIPEGRLIMLTSSLPNEGKTFVSINLALSMALERDIHLILVDADVAKRHISRIFGIESELGLLDSIRDESLDLESLIRPTSVPNLSVLGAGRPSETASELLSSHRMTSVIGKLGIGHSHPRVIIFDSSPLLLTSEARVLSQFVGQIVVVVRAGVTQKSVVIDALNCISGDRPIMLVLNQSVSAHEPGYYYYGGTYGESGEVQSNRSEPSGQGDLR